MIIIQDKTDCCGCSSCEQVCPANCIVMAEDKEGFLFPQVNVDMCVDCGACERVCPIIHATDIQPVELVGTFDTPKAIGGWIKDEEVRADSSSGGAFTLFANYILASGGIVYGASLCEDMVVRHICVENTKDLTMLRGSKYVQSTIGVVYSKIKDDIQTGRKILFSGTPCQVAGLYSFLGNRKYSDLYTVDFICHGTPSPKVFSEYVKYIERKYDSKIKNFRFRLKDHSWNPSGLQLGTGIELDNGKFIRNFPAFNDPFMNGFLDDSFLRESCYNCRFKCLPKVYADITIADFWGVTNHYPELNDRKGTSLVLFNGEHGEKLFEDVKEGFYYKVVDFNKAIQKNPTLMKSAKKNVRRYKFFRDFQNKSFEYLMLRYMNPFIWGIHTASKISLKLIQKTKKTVINCALKKLHI